jgi:hypothetical protein
MKTIYLTLTSTRAHVRLLIPFEILIKYLYSDLAIWTNVKY